MTLEKNLDVPFRLDEFALSAPNPEELAVLFRELEFTTLLSQFVKRPAEEGKSYRPILDRGGLESLASDIRKAGFVSLDTETDSPEPTRARLVGMSFATRPGEAFYLPLGHDYEGAPSQIPMTTAFEILKESLGDPAVRKIGQNIKYDFIVLRRAGLEIAGIELDTMILSYLLEPNWGKHNLDRLALAYLQTQTIPYEEVTGKGKNQVTMNAVPLEKVVPYACQDADLALELSKALWPKVQEKSWTSFTGRSSSR